MGTDEFGILHLGQTFPDASAACWTDCTFNAVALLAAILIFTVNLGNFLHILPEILSCMLRSKPMIALEHNIHSRFERSVTAWALIPMFAIIADRYRLYDAAFIERLPYGWSLPVTILLILGFVLCRYIFFPFRPRTLRGDISRASHCALFTCFVGMMLLMIPTACVMLALHIPDDTARVILLYETGAFFLLSIIRTAQFLSRQCSVFSTILYLCALELMPAALVVASARIF